MLFVLARGWILFEQKTLPDDAEAEESLTRHPLLLQKQPALVCCCWRFALSYHDLRTNLDELGNREAAKCSNSCKRKAIAAVIQKYTLQDV